MHKRVDMQIDLPFDGISGRADIVERKIIQHRTCTTAIMRCICYCYCWFCWSLCSCCLLSVILNLAALPQCKLLRVRYVHMFKVYIMEKKRQKTKYTERAREKQNNENQTTSTKFKMEKTK